MLLLKVQWPSNTDVIFFGQVRNTGFVYSFSLATSAACPELLSILVVRSIIIANVLCGSMVIMSTLLLEPSLDRQLTFSYVSHFKLLKATAINV